MRNYFDEGIFRDSIIQKEEFLLPDYLPDEILHRERQLQAMADALRPLVKKSPAINLFIHGPAGVGKTTSIKYILKQLSDSSTNLLIVFVNCWQTPTQLGIYNRIIDEMKLPLPRRGLAADEIFDKILSYMRNYNRPVIIVLDDVDGLEHQEVLYSISRSNDSGSNDSRSNDSKIIFAILAVANNKNYLAQLDFRIRSSLRFSELEFRSYSAEELFSIIKLRAEAALVPGSYDDKLLLKIANSTEGGSARRAIELLWKAAKHADGSEKKTIMIQDLEDVLAESASASIKPELKTSLSKEEQLIVGLLNKSEKGLESSELYGKFIAKIPKSKRQIRNYLDLLEEKGIIVSKDAAQAEGKESIMKSRIFSLKSPGSSGSAGNSLSDSEPK
ncbi:AAA family ATPase [Candidatus Micrarchaeota archaeon]|nr:AAA family ATPase [Candidatus Micrarchaeota archaeon]